jgi:hypothetical protein
MILPKNHPSKLVIALFLGVLLSFATSHAADNRRSMELSGKLLKTLESFASENDLTMAQTIALTSDLILREQLFSQKAGLGLVRDQVYVDTSGSKNRIMFGNSKKQWVGIDKTEKQVVAIIGDEVVPVTKGQIPSNGVTLVIFEPTKIGVIDVTKGSGGYYAR